MEELIERIVVSTGLEPQTAHQAVGLILNFLKKQAPDGAIGDMIRALPGGEQAADQAAASAGGGGLMGTVGGLLGGLGAGGAGGMMALVGQLTSKGLDMEQMQSIGKEMFKFGEQQIGPDKAREIFGSIPGMSKKS